MPRNRVSTIATIAASLFALSVALFAGQQRDASVAPGKDFPLPGGDLGNQRYSTLKRITPANVGRLGGAWMVHVLDGTPGNMQATPVVIDGVMYVATEPGGGVIALDAATGAVKWKRRPSAGVGRGVNRGVVAADGKVFSSGGDNTLVALDQKDGSLLWTTKVGAAGPTLAPPIYHDGLVYIGVSGGEAGVRGFFGAFDATTGKEAWGFWLVPGPGEPGHDTWEGDSWMRGGVPVWTHPAIDPALGMVYIATGNAWPDFDGSVRGGDNLYAASVVALDLKTGAYKWHFQEVHHDVWDYDNVVSPVLADIPYQGQTRKVLMHSGKTGFLYILDRTNGKPLIGIEERDVPQEPRIKTAKTQPFPIGDSYVPTCPEPGSVPDRHEERVHLRRVLRRAGRDGAGHPGRHDVGADDVQPGHADSSTCRVRSSTRCSSQKGGFSRPPGRATCRHAHGDESRDEQDRLAEAPEVSDRRG